MASGFDAFMGGFNPRVSQLLDLLLRQAVTAPQRQKDTYSRIMAAADRLPPEEREAFIRSSPELAGVARALGLPVQPTQYQGKRPPLSTGEKILGGALGRAGASPAYEFQAVPPELGSSQILEYAKRKALQKVQKGKAPGSLGQLSLGGPTIDYGGSTYEPYEITRDFPGGPINKRRLLAPPVSAGGGGGPSVGEISKNVTDFWNTVKDIRGIEKGEKIRLRDLDERTARQTAQDMYSAAFGRIPGFQVKLIPADRKSKRFNIGFDMPSEYTGAWGKGYTMFVEPGAENSGEDKKNAVELLRDNIRRQLTKPLEALSR